MIGYVSDTGRLLSDPECQCYLPRNATIYASETRDSSPGSPLLLTMREGSPLQAGPIACPLASISLVSDISIGVQLDTDHSRDSSQFNILGVQQYRLLLERLNLAGMSDIADFFASLPPEAKEAYLNGPAHVPPHGVVPDFENPQNHNGMAIAVVTTGFIIASALFFVRVYARLFCFKKVHIEDGKLPSLLRSVILVLTAIKQACYL